jgi:hypothetical protein
MALVFADGFDHYLYRDILKKWTGQTSGTVGTSVIAADFARPPGGMGINLLEGSTARGFYKTLSATHASFVCGFAINFTAGAPTNTSAPFWAVWDSSAAIGATAQLGLRGDAGGHLVLYSNTTGTILATSTNTFSGNVWYHIEIKATIHNTAGAYEVRVNGSSVGWIPAASSKNTRQHTTNAYIDSVGFMAPGITTAYLDDFYFLSSASPNNDFLGPIKVMTAFPAGAGNYAQWVGNFASNFTNTQELAGDGDNTFNQSATANQIDTFGFDDMPTGTIIAVQDVMMARQDAGAARVVRTKFRSGGGSDYSGTSFNMAGSYQFHCDPRDVDPATSSAYTVTNFNAQERGYELVS